jgi:lipoprotein-anchoring transpeptidase ErfK/SrfK
VLDRRLFVTGAAAALLGGCASGPQREAGYDAGAQYRLLMATGDEPFMVQPIALSSIPEQYHRQTVPNPTGEPPGTIVVDPAQRFLYLVQADGTARRYGIGVGREGFGWSGAATIGAKREWPKWYPPVEMQARDERARQFANGMEGGPENPLGARAMYLFQGGRDTLYRIHGTNEPHSIGRAVSSGCIRMLNADVIDLYNQVPIGTRVVVLPSASAVARLG